MSDQRLMIRNFRDVGPACAGATTKAQKIKALLELAEPVPMENYVVSPEVVASADDPEAMALNLLIYGTVVVRSGMSERVCGHCGRPVCMQINFYGVPQLMHTGTPMATCKDSRGRLGHAR